MQSSFSSRCHHCPCRHHHIHFVVQSQYNHYTGIHKHHTSIIQTYLSISQCLTNWTVFAFCGCCQRGEGNFEVLLQGWNWDELRLSGCVMVCQFPGVLCTVAKSFCSGLMSFLWECVSLSAQCKGDTTHLLQQQCQAFSAASCVPNGVLALLARS